MEKGKGRKNPISGRKGGTSPRRKEKKAWKKKKKGTFEEEGALTALFKK